MVNKRDLAVLQFIAVVVILFTASWSKVRQFLSPFFPYAEVVIPAGAFVLLFQALFFIYSRFLWVLHPQTTYLGGQWIYKTSNAKQRNFDHASLDKRSQYFYGVFEVIHTADELHINNGEAWYCGEPPSFTNRRVFWKSDAIVHRDEKLWIVASATGEDKSRSHLTQLAELAVIRRNSQIEMKGTIWGVADPDGEYAYGFTEIKKISNRPREDAAREAYRIFGSP